MVELLERRSIMSRGRKQTMYPNPAEKHMIAYQKFHGGLNTVDANDNLQDHEFPNLINIDLSERGSLKKRAGFKATKTIATMGEFQGIFPFQSQTIVAMDGKLYTLNQDSSLTEIIITNLTSFQTTRPVEAVQVGDSLYVATGTRLVEVKADLTAAVVEPYETDSMEYLYLGGNGLADDPQSHITNRTSSELFIDAVMFSQRYGVVHQPFTISIYVAKPDTMTVEFKIERKWPGKDTWYVDQDWTTTSTKSITTQHLGSHEIRVWVREQGITDTTQHVEYNVPRYTVKEVYDGKDDENDDISACNRILKHWERLVLYGNPNNKKRIYVSELNKFNYFPIPNSVDFDNPSSNGVTKVIRYRDMLVSFSDSDIQALFGTSPYDYRRVVLNTDVGAIAPESVKVVENHIIFLSQQGVYLLKSVGTMESRANVERIDSKIRNIVPNKQNACASVHENQYMISFPDEKLRFRFYYDWGVWTKDEGNGVALLRTWSDDGRLYGFNVNGEFGYYDASSFKDTETFPTRIETKMLDLGQPYNPKKLKELQILVRNFGMNTGVYVSVYADSELRVDPNQGEAVVDAEGIVTWETTNEPNVQTEAGTIFGQWTLGESAFGLQETKLTKLRLSGRCRQTKLIIENLEDTPHQLLGFGIVYKVKSP